MNPIIATVDFDAQDRYLVQGDGPRRSNWLLANAVVVRLREGQTFYGQQDEVLGPDADTLFARHLRTRRGTRMQTL